MTQWIAVHWFDLLQTIGIVGGLLFTAYATWKDEKSRKIGNLIAINAQYQGIWKEFYRHSELTRVLKPDADIAALPITEVEKRFIISLILHLNTVYHAMKEGMFVPIEGLQKDIRNFFSLPIPRSTWEKNRVFQNADFVRFVEESIGTV
jgi:hypothetical protein